MKILKFLASVILAVFINTAYAQQLSSIKLSEEYPEAGKKVAIIYNPGDGVLKGKTALKARVSFIGDNYPVEDVTLKPSGKLWTGTVMVDDSAKAMFINIKADTLTDNAQGKGFIFLVYKDRKPLQGAYAAKAGIYLMFDNWHINENNLQAIADYKKEFELYPASKSEFGTEFYGLLSHGDADDIAYVKKQAADFKGSDNEKDYMAVASALRALGDRVKADSVMALALAKFPKGELAAEALFRAANLEADLQRKDSLYNAYIAIAPPNNYMTFQLCIAYLEDGQLDKYEFYKRKLKDTTDIANSLNGFAFDLAKKNEHLPLANKIAREAMAMLKYKYEHPKAGGFATISEARAASKKSYDYAAETYNFVLYNQGRYAEAEKLDYPIFLKYQDDADVVNDYALMLIALKKYDKASEIIIAAIKRGKTSEDLNIALKKAYIGKHRNDTGFAAYIAPINEIARNKAKQILARAMLNIPAPAFELKDLDGNSVSLAALKGKTVIVDFWATWCGPCKASMPGMQLAVEKYKDDPNVKFLFIDTWETGDDYLPGVKKFIADNKYSFHVLLDDKGKNGTQGKVVSQFNVDGIPAKFIIDKNGIIRFKYIGYDGTPGELVDEVSDMITLVN